jgi:hypothetical protein
LLARKEKGFQKMETKRQRHKASPFIKPIVQRGIAGLGISGLVIGLGVAGTGSALASGASACSSENTVTAVADTTANTIAIQAKLASDGVEQTVCLSGNFVINDQIDFVGTKHIKGVGESSSIKNPLEAGDMGENNVFTADFTNSMNVITSTTSQ